MGRRTGTRSYGKLRVYDEQQELDIERSFHARVSPARDTALPAFSPLESRHGATPETFASYSVDYGGWAFSWLRTVDGAVAIGKAILLMDRRKRKNNVA
jgi:hypothetical protein